MTTDFAFDVAFSFAGEQRPYVENTYRALKEKGIRVFYDGGEVASLWGKDLYQELSDVYSNRARYCVVFLSGDYAAKLWTKHELKIVQARAFQESREYILPARFDDTQIPGLLPQIGYIDLRSHNPQELADIIEEKLRGGAKVEEKADANTVAIELALADAVIWAQDYLSPQPLDLSDNIAAAVRRAFEKVGLQVERRHLVPYLRSPEAPHRVVGYIAFQVKPVAGMELDLVGALRLERGHAANAHETRPLWQLLVCITFLLKRPDSDHALLGVALKDFLSFLEQLPEIDPGGQCKARIRMLVGRL
jgi:hypothetical protein